MSRLRVLPLLVALAHPPLVGAQTLHLPERSPDAPTGSELARVIGDLALDEREERILAEILGGNVPSWLRPLEPVHLQGPGETTVTVWVTVDYLAVGSDVDYLLMPMRPNTAQRIADVVGASLPTPRLVDAIWEASVVKLDPSPIPPSPEMTTVTVFAEHSRVVDEQRGRGGPGRHALTAGHKKDVVISSSVASSPGHVAIYGWHERDGTPIQPLYLGHTDDWVDYSHGVRLVAREILVDGAPTDLWDALGDPELAAALSSEGIVLHPRYPSR